MRRRLLAAKIHRATVTDANVDYVGSVAVDAGLLAAAGIVEWEQVHLLDVDNGARLVTYAMAGGPGQVCVNGAAARLVAPGHKVIIVAYGDYDEAEVAAHRPRIVHLDDRNRRLEPAAL